MIRWLKLSMQLKLSKNRISSQVLMFVDAVIELCLLFIIVVAHVRGSQLSLCKLLYSFIATDGQWHLNMNASSHVFPLNISVWKIQIYWRLSTLIWQLVAYWWYGPPPGGVGLNVCTTSFACMRIICCFVNKTRATNGIWIILSHPAKLISTSVCVIP